MEKPRTPEQAESSIFSLRATRSRVAAVMIGLAGSVAVPAVLPACKASLSDSVNLSNKANKEAVDKDGSRVIVIPHPGAVIVYETKETDGGIKLEALMQISDSSFLHQVSRDIREYPLPAEADPWVRMVIEPSGRISLRHKADETALVFDCGDLRTSASCKGHDEDPKELDGKIADAKKTFFEERIEAAKKATWERKQAEKNEAARRDAEDTDPETEAGAGTDAKSEGAADTGSLADKSYSTTAEIKVMLDVLKPVIEGLDWPAKQKLARALASVKPEWTAYVEKEIADINASPTGNLEQLNLNSIIIHLLVLQPDMIETVAAMLNVTLPEAPQTDAGAESDADAATSDAKK